MKETTEAPPPPAATVTATPTAAAAVATQPQQFPSTKQFDTSFEEPPQESGHNWSSSFFGLSTERFPREVADILLEPINADDVEVKPGKET